MWISFAIGALGFNALEETVDKIAVVEGTRIDFVAATFWRNFIFLLWFIVFTSLGVLGQFQFLVTWPIAGMAFLFVASSFFYTYLLKKIEVTSEAAASYVSPFMYLFIDVALLKLRLTNLQIGGILLLITGGFLFILNPKTWRFKREFTPNVLVIFFFDFLINAAQYYGFKYYFERYALNEASYYINVWLLMMPVFLFVVAYKRGWFRLKQAFQTRPYLAKITISKGCDAAGSYLWLHAIGLASVSQVNAFEAAYPLMVLITVYVLQAFFGFKANERFSGGGLAFKLTAVALLFAGGIMAR